MIHKESELCRLAASTPRTSAYRLAFPESGDAQLSLFRDLRAVDRRPEAIANLETYLKSHPAGGPES